LAASHLSCFCSNVGGKYNVNSLIKEHTILPYYLPFLPAQRQIQVIDMIGNDAKGLFAALGITAGGLLSKNQIKYCLNCAIQDISKYGEPYFHREHQLQGVLLCPHDGFLLKEYPIEDSRIAFTRMKQDLTAQCNCNSYEGEFAEILLAVSKAAYDLINLNSDFSNISCKGVLTRYKSLLNEQGFFLSVRGSVRQGNLHDAFQNRYTQRFLNQIDCSIDKYNEYCWLKTITRNSARSVHPLRNILLMLFLSGDVTSFFDGINSKNLIFDKAPYPCLNPACKNYRRNVIYKTIVTPDSKTRQPVETFECKCGFIYSRRGPDKTLEDRYRIGRIKQYGQVWEDKLQELLSKGIITRQIAIKMNCDPMTVKKYAAKSPIIDKKCHDILSHDLYKQQIIDFVRINPQMSRTSIRENMQKQYAYLYRHEKEWLLANLPTESKSTGSKGYVDWNARDEIILARLHIAKQQIIESSELTRASMSRLIKMSGFGATLEHYKENLPMSSSFLSENSETLEDYRNRRCCWWFEHKSKYMAAKPWKMMRDMGINKKDFELLKNKFNWIEDYTESDM
jgi:hypothetical protein